MELRDYKKKNKNIISKVWEGSIAEELGIECGDIIHSINATVIEDIVEYTFLQSDEYIELEIEKKDGEVYIFEIQKEYDEELGIEFSNPIIDSVKTCNNDCVFCFVSQLPEGMRETLYIKDDDSRLSFLQGNFITMTNMKDADIDRMIRYRISPVNISVHTSNPELRVKMLNNRFAGDILSKIKRLADANLEMNGQIVCVPDFNDKEELDRTINDLAAFYPQMGSIAVVPVGVTKYRENLPQLKIFDKNSSKDLIDQLEKLQDKFLECFGTRFVFPSDEFYVMAEKEIPKEESYEGYIQIENGVGLIRKFQSELEEALDQYQENQGIKKAGKKKISIATGTSAYSFMEEMAKFVMEKVDSVDIETIKIYNDFFGRTITVAGLITGQDLYKQLKDYNLGDFLLLPRVMFRSDDLVFLDDMTVEDLEEKLNVKIIVSEIDGFDFLENIVR